MASLSAFPYTELPAQYVRVLELAPAAEADAPLIGTLVSQDIAEAPYEALSYVWGDPTPVDHIACTSNTGEGDVGIGASLAKALRAFRLADVPRRIWVDRISINQEDLSERQSQVRLMGRVFSDAQHVLCWLGPFNEPDGEDRARRAVSFVREFNKQPQVHLRAAQKHLLFAGSPLEDPSEDPLQVLTAWLAIKELFDQEYFHRAWIIQEIGLARHARIFWGSSALWLDWTELADFSAVMDYQGASIVNHLQLKSWMANHISLVWATDASGAPAHKFVEVLHWARVHRSTDPRDYIYALISHSSAFVDGQLLIEPNYRITTSEVYTRLAVNVVEKTQSILILAFVDHGEETGEVVLPTWVPDWHAVNLVAPLRTPTNAAANTDNSLSVTRPDGFAVLKCTGTIIDDVCTISEMLVASEFTVTTLEKELQKKTPFLIDHLWEQVIAKPGLPAASLDQVLNSLSFVLTGGFRDGVPALGAVFEAQKADFAAFILEYEKIKPETYPSGFISSLLDEDLAVLEGLAAQGSAGQFTQDMTWNSMCRNVFRTAKGYIGLGPRTMAKDDICAVLNGSIYPIILRRRELSFELIGPALLYGYMDGEAEKLCKVGTLEKREFNLI